VSVNDEPILLRKAVRGLAVWMAWWWVVFAGASYLFLREQGGRRLWLPIAPLALLALGMAAAILRLRRKQIVLTSIGFSAGRLELRWDQVERLTYFWTPSPYEVGTAGYQHWIGVWPITGVALPPFTHITRVQRALVTHGAPAAISIDNFAVGVHGVLDAFERFCQLEMPDEDDRSSATVRLIDKWLRPIRLGRRS
jgi:hypothetical protein